MLTTNMNAAGNRELTTRMRELEQPILDTIASLERRLGELGQEMPASTREALSVQAVMIETMVAAVSVLRAADDEVEPAFRTLIANQLETLTKTLSSSYYLRVRQRR